MRWTFFWQRIETREGGFNWSVSDKFVGDLGSPGIRVLPVVLGSPKWAEPSAITPPVGSEHARTAWKGFLRAAVNRYGPGGSYWTLHYTGQRALPIKAWQVWNEPNLQGAMKPPKPGTYVKLLKLSRSAIKDADSHAKVMFAGMPGYSGNVDGWDFLKRACRKKGAARVFDVAALHPYARTVHQMFSEIKRFRRVMQTHGDRHKPLWITEIGRGSKPKHSTPFGQTKGKTGQARILKHSFHTLESNRHHWHIKKVLWFNFRDPAGGSVAHCSFCSSAGLLQRKGRPSRCDAGRVVRRAAASMIAAAILAGLFAAPSVQAKRGSKLFGVDYSFKDLTGTDASKVRQSGAKTLRWMFVWPRIEGRRGVFDWSQPDKLVGDLAAEGIRVAPTLWGSPKWVEKSAVTPPIDSPEARNAWTQFLTEAVNRYGPNGSYWAGPYQADHPGKPALPIDTWQIWNEPNLHSAMSPVDPGNYAKLLELSQGAIKGADSSAMVMFAGMPGYAGNANAWDFLDRVYQTPGARNAFDLAALHPYARNVPQMLGEIRRVRATMQSNGDGHKPLWVTEIGWGSLPKNATAYGETKGMRGQARILETAFHALKKERYRWHIKRVLWFNFRDPGGGSVKACSFCSSAGLLEHDGTPKRAWSAFRSFTR